MKERHFHDEEIPENINEEKTHQYQDNRGWFKNPKNDNLEPPQTDGHQQKYDSLANVFSKSREYWTDKVKEHSENFRHVERVTELQAELFSDRQIILEQKHKLFERVSKMNNENAKDKRSKFLYYVTNYELKLNGKEKDIFIEADLANKLELIELIDNHINYLDQTIKTLDNMIFGIKYRVSLYEMIEK